MKRIHFDRIKNITIKLVDSVHFSHGRLDVERPHVLPILLQEGYEEVDRQHDISVQLVGLHANVTDSNRKTQDFLHLEFDCSFDGLDLVLHRFLVRESSGEFTSFVQTGSWAETCQLVKRRP